MKKFTGLAIALIVAFATPLTASAAHHGNKRVVTGRITSVEGSTLILDTGAAVFLATGTKIGGGGLHNRLHAGEMVKVSGTPSGDRNINAKTVTIMAN